MLAAIAGVYFVMGPKDHEHNHSEHGHSDHGHHHEAPHGGTLAVLGDHFAHMEVVLDDKAGKVTLYLLGAHAVKAVRLKQKEITLTIKAGENKFDITTQAIADELTGETIGDTSVFEGQSDSLKGLKKFNITIVDINVRGKQYKNFSFDFPEGNEH